MHNQNSSGTFYFEPTNSGEASLVNLSFGSEYLQVDNSSLGVAPIDFANSMSHAETTVSYVIGERNSFDANFYDQIELSNRDQLEIERKISFYEKRSKEEGLVGVNDKGSMINVGDLGGRLIGKANVDEEIVSYVYFDLFYNAERVSTIRQNITAFASNFYQFKISKKVAIVGFLAISAFSVLTQKVQIPAIEIPSVLEINLNPTLIIGDKNIVNNK